MTDFPLGRSRSQQLAAELRHLKRQLATDLGVPPVSGTVRIYIFKSHRHFARYVRKHIPYLTRDDTNRSALFLLRNDVAHIFAVDGNDLPQRLRHEFVHVSLNAWIQPFPIWLDEGLAQYYESTGRSEKRAASFSFLRDRLRRGWNPDLTRLEQLKQMQQMGRLEYAESWLWVDWVMTAHAPLKKQLRDYLAELSSVDVDSSNGRPLSLSQRAKAIQLPQTSWERHVELRGATVSERAR